MSAKPSLCQVVTLTALPLHKRTYRDRDCTSKSMPFVLKMFLFLFLFF